MVFRLAYIYIEHMTSEYKRGVHNIFDSLIFVW